MNSSILNSSDDIHFLTKQDDEHFNLNEFLKNTKFKLINLNSSLINKFNRKLVEEFHLSERSNENQSLGVRSNKNYQSFNDQTDDDTIEQKNKFKSKFSVFKILKLLNLNGNGTYEELKSSKDESNKDDKIKKKKKMIKKIKKITIDVCNNLGTGVNLMNGTYNYPTYSDQFYGFNYNQYNNEQTYHNDYSYNYTGYNTSIIYGPRYM